IQNRELSLKPNSNSGWYDYALWALEPLVLTDELPESHKREFSPEYTGCLLDLFKGVYCLTRETHVKQLEILVCGSASYCPPPQIQITPEFSVEPLPSVFYRRAFGYGFLYDVLVSTFGEQALKDVSRIR